MIATQCFRSASTHGLSDSDHKETDDRDGNGPFVPDARTRLFVGDVSRSVEADYEADDRAASHASALPEWIAHIEKFTPFQENWRRKHDPPQFLGIGGAVLELAGRARSSDLGRPRPSSSP
jgi:hypothetical protein